MANIAQAVNVLQSILLTEGSKMGSKSKIMHMPLPSDDPQQRKPDISLARKMLNDWEPTIQLRDGLVKTIAYFEDILSRGSVRH